MQFSLDQSQKNTLALKSQQALAILQMSAEQLDAFLLEKSLENPFVEYRMECPLRVSASAFRADSGNDAPSDADAFLNLVGGRQHTLYDHLTEQIGVMRLSRSQSRTMRFLIANLDARGYLDLSVQEIMRQMGIGLYEAQDTVRLLHTCDPAGVGARSLSECLLIQLRRSARNPVAEQIVRLYLRELARGNVRKLSELLDASEQEVRAAAGLIRSLNPKPSNGFAPAEYIPYAPPDLLVLQGEGDTLIVSVNPDIRPDFHVNTAYAQEIRAQVAGRDEQTYIRNQLFAARQIETGIQWRESTLLRCGREIVARQSDFFRGERSAPGPYLMRELANDLALHPSTVTRMLKSKSLRCRYGTFPLSFFFPRPAASLEEASLSAASLRQTIAALLENEAACAPLSDQQIVEMLFRQGISLSRRAVTKYRNELSIPSSYLRKGRADSQARSMGGPPE